MRNSENPLRLRWSRSPRWPWPAPGSPRPSRAASESAAASGEPAQPSADTTYYDYSFGARDLQLGNAGEDVKTLNWVLRGLALGTPYSGAFQSRHRRRRARLPGLGRRRRRRRRPPVAPARQLAARMLNQNASWYGPGFWGNTTACGQTLTKKMVGVAHKKLPCGTRVVFAYKGRWARAKVIDRGPFIAGRKWDLTEQLAKRLDTIPVGTATVKAVVAP